MENPVAPKKQSFSDKLLHGSAFSDPDKSGWTAIGCGLVSFLVLGQPLASVALGFGAVGLYVAIKKKSTTKAKLLHIIAIILGGVSLYFLSLTR